MNNKMNILVTGGAGFIGSHIVDALLSDSRVGQVRILDNLTTGSTDNMSGFINNPKVEFMKGDIRDYATCLSACEGINLVCHQAALGSVPRSVKDPVTTNEVNISGTLNIFQAAREKNIKRVVYASSSSVYGDNPDMPKVESKTGNPLSPYAVTKKTGELYAKVFSELYGMDMIGLRYFNVFGPRQSPEGPYAAVIPLFVQAAVTNTSPVIYGDGLQSRDFTYIDNVVQVNLLGLFTGFNATINKAYNVAVGERTTILDIFEFVKNNINKELSVVFKESRNGDIPHSLANIDLIKSDLNYKPTVTVKEGLMKTINWFTQERSVK